MYARNPSFAGGLGNNREIQKLNARTLLVSSPGYSGWQRATIALIVVLIVVTLSFIGYVLGTLLCPLKSKKV